MSDTPGNESVETHQDGTTERWRDVVGYEGRYRVSDRGRIRSVARTVFSARGSGKRSVPPKIISQELMKTGHLRVQLIPLGTSHRQIHHFVHRLVLEAFVGSRPEGCECRHFPDRDPANNRLENLQWGTKKENAADRKTHGTNYQGEKHCRAKLTEECVRHIRSLYATGLWSKKKLARQFNVSRMTIRSALLRFSWKHVE